MPIYEQYCKKCDYSHEYLSLIVTDVTNPCIKCGGKTEREWSLPAFHDFGQLMHTNELHPYVTSNIRRDGKPIEIRSHAQLEKACRENGVTPAFGKENKIG